MSKKVNPYEKKNKKRFRITRKHWIAALSVVGVAAILISISVMTRSCGADPHAGHDHSNSGGEHYEGDGHDHGNTTTAKVRYQTYAKENDTYDVVFRDEKGTVVKEVTKIPKTPMRETVDAANGIYALSWATDQGPNDYMSVYFNEKTGQVSDTIHAARGTDGVRIAYGSEDQTKVIVQNLFDQEYYKEYPLTDAYTKGDDVIVGGMLQSDKKTVAITYIVDEKKATNHIYVKLYE